MGRFYTLRDVQQTVDGWVDSLRERRPQRGPAQDMRQAIDLVLRHTDVHGSTLWVGCTPLHYPLKQGEASDWSSEPTTYWRT